LKKGFTSLHRNGDLVPDLPCDIEKLVGLAGPWLGSDAYVKYGATECGYATGVDIRISADIIKEYVIGQVNPGVLKTGPQSYPVSVDKMMLDTEACEDVLNGDTLSLVVQPGGTESGSPKFTVGNITFNEWELHVGPEGVIIESLKGEGTTFTSGTV